MEDDGGDVGRGVRAAAKLVGQDKVDFINGTLTSSVRTAVFEELKKTQTLFLNPTYYEGLLCDQYYFSSGATPNHPIQVGPKLVVEIGCVSPLLFSINFRFLNSISLR